MTSSFLPDHVKINEPATEENVEMEILEQEMDIAELDKKLDYALMKLLLSNKKELI